MRLNLSSTRGAGVPRRTRERELILDRLPTLPGHFSAEDLASALRRERVSRATVYRTLDLLVDQGLLQRVHLDEKGACYEMIRGRAPHAHLYCLGCGRLSDYPLPMLARLSGRVERQEGFHAEHLLLRICGYCQQCRARGVKKSSLDKTKMRNQKNTKRRE